MPNKPTQSQYLILSHPTVYGLQEEVNNYTRRGWKTSGSMQIWVDPFSGATNYHQPVIMETNQNVLSTR